VRQVIVDLTLSMAKENPRWGCDRIQGALAAVGYHISDTTDENILKRNGIEPVPNRKATGSWETFLKAHWDVLAAVDFTTVEVWTPRGLVTYYLLFVMELKSRRVCFAGCTPNPTDAWMVQQARNLTDCEAGFLIDKKFLIMDRDPKFCGGFRSLLKHSGVQSFRLPARSPNMNAHMERFFGSLKRECLDQLVLFGERSLRNAVCEYMRHYHRERPHQGLGNQLITPRAEPTKVDAPVETTERLGGLLRSYQRAA
jgi:transposase InsO family protein